MSDQTPDLAAARPDRFRCCECCKTEHLAERDAACCQRDAMSDERDALAARIAKVEALLDVRPSDPFCDVDDAGRPLFVLVQDLRKALRGEVDG